ncbi:ABC transporter ATP-binding protein [Collinsella sp. zg1085]|uniref:ATP-binding cassette domain-containing protein n=1 Tax=Collinsella sp. zg1085 TaxID=2844380 RepID=UPI001C0B007B|nr:ABC transporter ATP-binding protein [Collinsella sp. zg1085]QWT17630.1 ABC transporter ATP-binding protein [Collinsella sp. zg1085]
MVNLSNTDQHIAVRIHKVSKHIKDRQVLASATAEFPAAHIVGISGPNGSGKTMLLRAIAGLLHINQGTIEVWGKSLGTNGSFPESMGILIEPIALWDELSGAENLKLLAQVKGNTTNDKVQHALERVELNPHDKRPIRSYSLGMRQRLYIAQAIMDQPQLILLDEPTNALDESGKALVRSILFEERNRGALIVVVSHDKDELDAISDSRYTMYEGVLSKVDAL